MTKFLKNAALGLISFGLAHSVLWANGSRLPSQDSRDIARGYASVAGGTGPSSLYINPAGLADVVGGEAVAGLYVIAPETTFRSSATGREIRDESGTFYQPHAFGAVRLGEGLSLGLGTYSPFGQSTKWPASSGFAGIATFNEIKYYTGALALGWRVTPDLAVGVGLQYSRAKVSLNRLTAIAPGFVTAFGFSGDGSAPSGNLGLRWKPAPDQVIGIQYQRKTDLHFSGTASLAGVMSQHGEVGWIFPDNLSAGWAWNFAPGWQSEVSVDWTNWDRVRTLQLRAGPLSTAVPLNWKSSAYYGVGITRHLTSSLDVSAGYNFSQNSIPDASFTPALPDMDRHLLGAGVFWRRGAWEMGLVAQRGLPSSRTVRGPAPDGLGGSAAGTYRTAIWAGAASISLKF